MNNDLPAKLPEDGKFPELNSFFCFADFKNLSWAFTEHRRACKAVLDGNEDLRQTLVETELQIIKTIRTICESYVRVGGGPGCMGDKNDPARIFRNSTGTENPGCVEVIAMMAAARGQVLKEDD